MQKIYKHYGVNPTKKFTVLENAKYVSKTLRAI